jgi:homocysteine S-methyltransferase
MQDIRTYLKDNILVADGAAGTYMAALTGRSAAACEKLNISDPALVRRVHAEYIRSGAKLIYTNTFGANRFSLGADEKISAEIIRAGIAAARAAAGEQAYVAGDIGPLPEGLPDDADPDAEYRRIADVFLGEGIKTFALETFARASEPVKIAKYIKSKAPDAFVLISFAVTPDGTSNLGIPAAALLGEVKQSAAADSAGFNCCTGPSQLMGIVSALDFGALIPSVMPNAGYPLVESDVISYSGTPDYFADKLAQAADFGFRILGGCCGTTPAHIMALAGRVHGRRPVPAAQRGTINAEIRSESGENRFLGLLESGRKVVVAELDPPLNADVSKFENAAMSAARAGADALTIADSPMAKPRADPVVMASRLRRLTGLDVIPHICCRDRNINALKSSLIAANIEGVRNILAVTGDPVPDDDRGSVKSVYNINSAGLCSFIRELDAGVLSGSAMTCGCAFNVNARNTGEELRRLERKIESGARFALTQPVFTDGAVKALREARGLGIKIIAGILTPLNYKNALFLSNEIPGMTLPDEVLAAFDPGMTREQGEEAGLKISLATAKKVSAYADGFYLVTPFNRAEVTARLIELMKKEKLVP